MVVKMVCDGRASASHAAAGAKRLCGDACDRKRRVEACNGSSGRRRRTMRSDGIARHATTWFDVWRVIHGDPKEETSLAVQLRLVQHSS